MHKKMRHTRYFPHLFGIIALLILIPLILLLLTQKAYSTIKIIDTHEHIETLNKARILDQVNRELDIEKTILLVSPIETITLNGSKSFTRYRENADEILKIAEEFPGRFLPFCTVSPADTDALEYIKSCIERGGKGIKLYNGHSYYYEVFNLPLDTPRMMPIYAYAERNNIPVLYHINISKYKEELENILQKHPNLVMNVPHFMVSSIKIDRVKELFDKYPNLYTDISFGSPQFLAAGFRRISNNPQKYIDFINEYPDRVLFGSDMVITETEWKDADFMRKTLQCYRDILEKKKFICKPVSEYYKKEADKFTESAKNCEPKEGDFCKSREEKMNSRTKWYKQTKTLNGLGLPDEILQKIYQENPLRFLNANQ
jgi:predicted TIM-barrel fold metal-dependent hydrolase